MTEANEIQAGNITFTVSQFGSVSFIDNRGIKRRIDDTDLGTALVETAKNGGGELVEAVRTEGKEKMTNVRTRVVNLKLPHQLNA